MEINEKDLGYIEDFIDGSLTGSALETFEQRMSQDEEFARLAKIRLAMTELNSEANEYALLKDQIGDVIKKEKASIFYTYRQYILPIAASIVIIFGIYLVIQFQGNSGEATNEFAETADSTSQADLPSTLYMDEPEVLAKIKIYDSTVLKSPIENKQINAGKPIRFTWQTNSDQFGMLYVLNDNNAVVLRQEVNMPEYSFQLVVNNLPHGAYKWYINEPAKTGSFIILK